MNLPPPDTRAGRVRFRVISMEDGMTLRQLLGRRLGLGVGPASDLVKAGGVYIGAVRTCIPTLRVREGERVTVYRGAAERAPVDPDALVIVHRDESCVVIDKPHGVPAGAAREGQRGAISQAVVQRLAREGVLRPYVGLVHSLEAEAAGLILFTIRGQDRASFFQRFAELDVRRVYRARLRGQVSGPLVCEAGLVRAGGELRVARGGEEAAPARTEFRPLGGGDAATLVELELRASARVEQVPLHARALGHELVEEDGLLALACVRMAFTHPLSGAELDLRATPPPWAAPG